jgi:hypothetical protein
MRFDRWQLVRDAEPEGGDQQTFVVGFKNQRTVRGDAGKCREKGCRQRLVSPHLCQCIGVGKKRVRRAVPRDLTNAQIAGFGFAQLIAPFWMHGSPAILRTGPQVPLRHVRRGDDLAKTSGFVGLGAIMFGVEDAQSVAAKIAHVVGV